MANEYGSGPVEEAAVRRIIELRRGGYTYRAIAAHLDRKGLRPRHAERWSAAAVRKIWLRTGQ